MPRRSSHLKAGRVQPFDVNQSVVALTSHTVVVIDCKKYTYLISILIPMDFI